MTNTQGTAGQVSHIRVLPQIYIQRKMSLKQTNNSIYWDSKTLAGNQQSTQICVINNILFWIQIIQK